MTKNVANNNYQNNQSMRPSKTSQFLTSDQYETALLAQLGKACLACMNITHKAYPGFNHASLNAGLFAKLGAFYLDMVKDPSIIIPDELVEQICRLKQATLFGITLAAIIIVQKIFVF
ncbi:MAG: hypothetical protein HWD59_06590 [Coxiellaceae bacterium]|nr:MAG: hypothetical protein HWD59_06590 [Coxiellaceae bacterium]